MAVDSFLVPPVERNLIPLKVRRVGQREDRQERKEYQEQANSGRKEGKKSKETIAENCVSGNKVDCKI